MLDPVPPWPQMPAYMGASHRFVGHTSEVELKLSANTFADLLAEATRALGELMGGQGLTRLDEGERPIEVESVDREALLVDFLNELIYLAEAEAILPLDSLVTLGEGEPPFVCRLSARLRYASVEETPSQVKAATRHGLVVKETGSGVFASVIFDV